jgi:hypothetical protein
MQGYIATLKSLRETLELIKKYDWQLMYSEYEISDKKDDTILNNYITEIAVWEQNHEGNIRNHKVWTTDIPYKNGITALHMDNNNLYINNDKITWNK